MSAGIAGQKVRVDEELEAYPTESVDLRCQFVDGGGRTKLTQVRRNAATAETPNVNNCIYPSEFVERNVRSFGGFEVEKPQSVPGDTFPLQAKHMDKPTTNKALVPILLDKTWKNAKQIRKWT